MMTSLLLVDVQGFEALAKGQAEPSALASELTHTMHGLTRQIAVMRAYCSTRVSTYRRTAYREAGFEIVETAGADETLILMSLDLYELSASDATYEEAIILGGTTDYTALARLARERLMMVSVADHSSIPSSLEALADGLIDLDDLEIDRSHAVTPSTSFKPRERAKPDALAARTSALGRPEKAQDKVDLKTEEKAADKTESTTTTGSKTSPITVTGSAGSTGFASASTVSSGTNGVGHAASTKSEKANATPMADTVKDDIKPAETKSITPVPVAKPSVKSDAKPAEPAQQSNSRAAIDAELENAIGSSLPDDLSSELEAELSAELLADAPIADSSKKPGADATGNDDTNIDALFANMTSTDDIEASSTATTSVDPAVKMEPVDVPPLAEPESDTDVDELLSRLMSDDLASEAPAEKKAALDVVPER